MVKKKTNKNEAQSKAKSVKDLVKKEYTEEEHLSKLKRMLKVEF